MCICIAINPIKLNSLYVLPHTRQCLPAITTDCVKQFIDTSYLCATYVLNRFIQRLRNTKLVKLLNVHVYS